MAMLAEPRRKQRVVNLRGTSAWSKDSGKFGQRMLERMGWAPGKGLGAREDGATAHVVARYKNDDHGLGFSDRNDQWTRHEDSFESLLAGLRSEAPAAPTEHVPASLEQKSKKSRARVHYHKFTRGKDLSRYSEKDLASIFGKKSLKNEEAKIKEDTVPQIDSAGEIVPKSADKEEEVKQEQQPQQVFTCGGNMADYFTSKLRALGRSELATVSSSPSQENQQITLQDLAQKENDKGNLRDLSHKKKEKKRIEDEEYLQNIVDVSQQGVVETENIDEITKRKKKKKKCDSEKYSENLVKCEYDIIDCGDLQSKKKKNKFKVVEQITPSVDDAKQGEPSETILNSDYKTRTMSEGLCSEYCAEKIKKKKKRKVDRRAEQVEDLMKNKKTKLKNVS